MRKNLHVPRATPHATSSKPRESRTRAHVERTLARSLSSPPEPSLLLRPQVAHTGDVLLQPHHVLVRQPHEHPPRADPAACGRGRARAIWTKSAIPSVIRGARCDALPRAATAPKPSLTGRCGALEQSQRLVVIDPRAVPGQRHPWLWRGPLRWRLAPWCPHSRRSGILAHVSPRPPLPKGPWASTALATPHGIPIHLPSASGPSEGCAPPRRLRSLQELRPTVPWRPSAGPSARTGHGRVALALRGPLPTRERGQLGAMA